MARKPTQEELSSMLDKGMGVLLKPDEVEKKKKSGDLPENFKVEEGFGVYKIEMDGNEYLCVTNVLCEKCVRTNGKVKRCEQHKKKKKPKKKTTTKKDAKEPSDVQDDASDREKISGLRHIDDDDDEEDKIDGAFTPDAVLTPGVGGAIILVPVDAKNNEKAGPPAKNMNHVKGILVRGAGYIPQFIPNDRLTKAHRLRFDNYIEGELVLQNGKEVFVPNTLGAAKIDDKTKAVVAANAAVADKVDQKTVDQIGKDMVIPVQVEVADNGMPVMKVLEEKPKDKETPVGILIKKDDQVEFVQIAGRELGGGKDAKMMPCAIPENAKQGDAIADIYVNSDGKQVAVKPGEAPKDAQITGQVVMGKNDQLVFVAKGEDKEEVIKKQVILTPEMKEKLEKEEVKLQAVVTGQTPEHIETQVNKIGQEAAAANLKKQEGGRDQGPYQYGAGGEVKSTGFGANQHGGSVFAQASPQGGKGGGSAGKGGGNDNNNNGPYQYGSGGEVKSVGFGANQHGGSVFATAGPRGGGGGQQQRGGGGAVASPSGGSGGSGGGGGSQGQNEVRSVGFGAQQYGGSQFARPSGAGGGKSSGGGGGGKSVASPAGGGGQNEVRSVGFGANQHGGSVFATKGGGGGGGYAAGAKSSGGGGGGGKSVASPAGGGGGQNEVRSVGFGANQYGASVFATNKATGGGGGAAKGGKTGTKSPSYSSNEPKSVGFGVNQFGGSVYARK